NGYNNGY
ncbi:hypothetical protein FOXB_11590, partial [Fusarium oxysporum f. sp. conglutinans Fo5176]